MAMQRWRPLGFAERWEPFRNLSDIQGEVNRLFETFVGRPAVGTMTSGRTWVPPVDMSETADDLVLAVEIPGIREKEVSVSITGDLLSIKGERRWEQDAKDGKENTVLHVERAYGQFERMIQLPFAVQADQVKATYRDGVLEVRLPKAEEVKPRAIKVDIL
jgi:HSP20 family protein